MTHGCVLVFGLVYETEWGRERDAKIQISNRRGL